MGSCVIFLFLVRYSVYSNWATGIIVFCVEVSCVAVLGMIIVLVCLLVGELCLVLGKSFYCFVFIGLDCWFFVLSGLIFDVLLLPVGFLSWKKTVSRDSWKTWSVSKLVFSVIIVVSRIIVSVVLTGGNLRSQRFAVTQEFKAVKRAKTKAILWKLFFNLVFL